MLEDTFESLEDQEEMEEEAEMEIDKILFEITAGEFVCVCVYVFAESAESRAWPLLCSTRRSNLKSSSILT